MARRIAFFDCFSGASGDMILSAMVDAGVEIEALRSELDKLHLPGWRLEADRVARQGLAGTHVRVMVDDNHPPERRLADIEEMIQTSALAGSVQERALSIFRALGEAEATVHGVPVEQVHFHEVGAIDALIDIVGASVGFELLGIDRAYASSLPVGLGSVKTAHGPLPLPAPATLALATRAKAPLRPAGTEVELVTPTGAAILTTCAEFTQPPLVVEKVGTGFGTRELPWPNVLRLWLGTPVEDGLEDGEVTII
ncbi:MAG TPA: LarC family nickel insertion protein, partial [Chloroflexota bacterium]